MAQKSTKKNLVQHLAKTLEVSPLEAERITLVVMRYIRKQLVDGTSVILPGIGTLAVTETAARLGRNPHTGVPVPIPPRKSVRLKVTRTLKDTLSAPQTPSEEPFEAIAEYDSCEKKTTA